MAKKYKRLTVEQLRAYPGFENHTDEEAEKIIETLETLTECPASRASPVLLYLYICCLI